MLAGWCQFGFCCLSYKQTLLIVFKIINISEPLICFVCDIGSMALRTEKEYESSYNKYNDNFIGQRNSKWQFCKNWNAWFDFDYGFTVAKEFICLTLQEYIFEIYSLKIINA